MKNLRFVFSMTALCLSLTACTHTVWVKPGATQGDYEQIKAACMVSSSQQIPQDNRTALISEGRSYSSRKCKANGTKCSSSSGYSPPTYGTIDNNQGLRDQVYKACLYKNGWQEVVVKDGEQPPAIGALPAGYSPSPIPQPPIHKTRPKPTKAKTHSLDDNNAPAASDKPSSGGDDAYSLDGE